MRNSLPDLLGKSRAEVEGYPSWFADLAQLALIDLTEETSWKHAAAVRQVRTGPGSIPPTLW